MCDDRHSEGTRPLGDEPPDTAEADESERLSVQLVAHKLHPVPVPAAGVLPGSGNPTSHREHQSQHQFGHRDRVLVRGERDSDSSLCGCGSVDVVQSDSGPRDDLQLRCVLQQLGGDLSLVSDNERFSTGECLAQSGRIVPEMWRKEDILRRAKVCHRSAGDIF